MNTLRIATLAALTLATGASATYPTLYLKPVVLQQFHSPTNVVNAGDGRLFITDQPGKIYIIEGGMMRPTPFLDLTDRIITGNTPTSYSERGLLGLAFHPGYLNSASPGYRKFYVYYSKTYVSATDPAPPQVGDPVNHTGVLAEFQVSTTDKNIADKNTERRLMMFTEPQSNHNGGQLEFGPESQGYLYFSLGDGGGQFDNAAGHTGGSGGGTATPQGNVGNSQDRTRIFGKILRLDPLGTNGPGGQYGIPADNPFVGAGGGIREEIWCLGMRNPWRFCFDKRAGGTNRLFCCDVGQNNIEEVDLITKGGNYGWHIKEGTFDNDATAPNPSGIALTPPIAEYAHPGSTTTGSTPQLGLSGTGGYVYRGSTIPALQGKYIFGDYGATAGSPSGRLMGLEETTPGSGVFTLNPAIPLLGGNPFSLRIMCLGEDSDGEIYVATKTSAGVQALENGLPNGGLYKLVPAPTNPAPLVLDAAKDNSLFSEAELSNGTGNLFTGQNATGDLRRALLAFDLTSVPAGSRFQSAILQLNVNQIETGTANQRNSILSKVLESWGEGTSFSTTGGVAATTNDATWTSRFYSPTSPTFWTSDGGEFSTTISSSLAVNSTGTWAWQSAQTVNDVHAWIAAPASNQGWILRSDEGFNSTTKRIDSRESAPAVRPKLTLVQASPYEKWLATYFPSNLTGQWVDPQGDLDGDGICNQLEYAAGLSPLAFNSSSGFVTSAGSLSAGSRTVTVTFLRDTAATDLTYSLQFSSDLSTWTSIAQSIAGNAATGLNGGSIVSETTVSGTVKLVTVSVTLTSPASERQFVHLVVDRTP